MKTVYLLYHNSADFEMHYDVVGVYETKELAEDAAKEYPNFVSVDDDDELSIVEVLLNHFTWE